ncbi:MAG TPA: hypothetical protein VFJ74_16765, partial [Gemmatimonadaceae bacterium]|nr:hypothetical protein [Gemmatimonadaceae bacterium]
DRPQTATELDDALGALAIAPWGEADARAWWASSKTEPLYLPDDVSLPGTSGGGASPDPATTSADTYATRTR